MSLLLCKYKKESGIRSEREGRVGSEGEGERVREEEARGR